MSFSFNFLSRVSSSGNIDPGKDWIYNGTSTGSDETLATIVAANYFDSAQSTLVDPFPAGYTGTLGPFAIGDILNIRGTDANGQYVVLTIAPHVTVGVWHAISGLTYSGSPAVIGDLPAFGDTSGDLVDSGILATAVATYTGSTVIGNLVSAASTTGEIQDAGFTAASVSGAVTQLGQLYQVSVTLNTAEVIAAYATPEVLIAGVAGQVAIVHSANVYTASTGNTPFATGAGPIIQYGTTAHGAGTIATGTGLVTGDITAAASQVRTINAADSAAYTGITNTAVTFSCSTAYTAGTGTSVTFTLVYELITATI